MHRSQHLIFQAGGLSKRWQTLAGGVAIGAFAAAAGIVAQDKGAKAAVGLGCAPDRPAIAHSAGGIKVAPPQGAEAPIPCVVNTGYRTSETALVVTNAGSIIFQPAVKMDPRFTLGVVRSADQGATWDFIRAADEQPPRPQATDLNMTIDRTTGRIFWIKIGTKPLEMYAKRPETPPIPNVRKPRLDISDDDGKTWRAGGAPLSFDHPIIFTGPPTAKLKHLQKGYPNVVYACVDHDPLRCQNSLDGGMTWGPEHQIPFPAEMESISRGASVGCSVLAFFGVVAADGTVYLGVGPCNRPYMAISHDEGSTWKLSQIANTEISSWGDVATGIDKQGNLYASYIAASDRLPYLSVSRDGGLTWSKPMMVAAPGVRETALPQLVAEGSGHVAIAYFGSTNAPLPFPPICGAADDQGKRSPTPPLGCPGYEKETWNMYITETWNAASQQPVFWSASLNDPAQPVFYGCSPSAMGVIRLSGDFESGPGFNSGCSPASGGATLGGRQDYFGINMAPDGTPWVGFGQACPNGRPVSGNPNCPATLTGAPEGSSWGMVGRLAGGGEADKK